METTETRTTKGDGDKGVQLSKKSGKGLSDGHISELTALFEILPGHEQELRAAVKRFADFLRSAPAEETIKTGLRSSRHVVLDGGKRLLWMTTFEQDWDPYIEDAFIVVGIDRFLDWMQHTNAKDLIDQWLRDAGGIEKIRAAKGSFRAGAEQDKAARMSSGGLKDIIRSVQFQAAAYFNPVGDVTHAEIRKAQKVNQAFQQVLDNPDAAKALQNPALKPLLDLAAE
jgi:hypothetical protein